MIRLAVRLGVLIALAVPVSASAVESTTLLRTTLQNAQVPVASVSIATPAGSVRDWYFNSYYHAFNNYPNALWEGQSPAAGYAQPLQSAQVRCASPGVATVVSAASSTNVPRDATSSTARIRDVVTLQPGRTYTCDLLGASGSSRVDAITQSTNNHYITLTSVRLFALDVTNATRATRWTNIVGTTSDDAVILGATPQVILRRVYTATGLSHVSVRADPQFDVTGPADQQNQSSTIRADTSVVQLTTNTSTITACSGGTQRSVSTQQTVTVGTHHRKLYTTLNGVPVASVSGCGARFLVSVTLTRVAGNNVDIRGLRGGDPNRYSVAMGLPGTILD